MAPPQAAQVSSTAAASAAGKKTPKAYGLGFRFTVKIDGVDLGGWQSCGGLKVSFQGIDLKQGGRYLAMTRLPDRVTYGNVTLKRAADAESSAKVQKWIASTAQKWVAGETSTASNVKIQLYDSNNQPVLTWVLKGARPASWSGPDLDANSNKVAIEMLELAHEGFEVTSTNANGTPAAAADTADSTLPPPTLSDGNGGEVKFPFPPEKVVVVRNKDERPSYLPGQGTDQTALLNKAGVTSYKMDNLIIDETYAPETKPNAAPSPTASFTRGQVDLLLEWATELPGASKQAPTSGGHRPAWKPASPGKGGKKGAKTGGEKQLRPIKFAWGTAFNETVQLVGLTANYTRFSPKGQPLRATVSFTLDVLANQSPTEQSRPKPGPSVNGAANPTSGGIPGRASHLLLATDSLPLLAREHYGSPGAWRDIARANGIDDPLRVRPGSRLYLPAFSELTEVGERR